MTPAARVQTAIGLLDQVIAAARDKGPPADRILADWFRASRFAGSKDRRAIRELVYAAIRHCGPIPQTGRAAMLALADADPALLLLFDGSNYGPAVVEEGELVAEGGIAPQWLVERLAASDIAGPEANALLERAPLDIRVNALKADRAALELPLTGEVLPTVQGLRFPFGTQVEHWPEYADGLIEIQDGGSQLACEAVAASAGETVIDLCAGAGGKTLALAAAISVPPTPTAAGFPSSHHAPRGRGCWSPRPCCSTRAARPRPWGHGKAGPTRCWSMRHARAPAPGGAIPKRAGASTSPRSRGSRGCSGTCSRSPPDWSSRAGGWSMWSARCSTRKERGRSPHSSPRTPAGAPIRRRCRSAACAGPAFASPRFTTRRTDF